MISFEIPGLPKGANQLNYQHWRSAQRERDRWYQEVRFALVGKIPRVPLAKARLVLERHSSVPIDPDQLASSFKYVVDALVHYRVLVDDALKNIGMPEYKWVKAKPKQGKIVVSIFRV